MSLALLERFTHGLPTERIPWEDSAEKQPGHGAGGNYHASLSTFENGSRRPSTRDHLSLCLHELIRFIVTSHLPRGSRRRGGPGHPGRAFARQPQILADLADQAGADRPLVSGPPPRRVDRLLPSVT